jgi:hypothetical protein
MAIPRTRQEFKDYLLRALGAPILRINVTDEQVDDRIEEALSLYYDYHFDGSFKIYYKHQVTTEDRENKFIPIPDYIHGVVNIFDMGMNVTSTNSLFSLQYQLVQNEVYTLLGASMVPYYTTMSHLQLIEQLLVGKKPLRYNRHLNRLNIDMNWDTVVEGTYIIVEAYAVTDPELYPDVWNDRWLKEYCIALVKRQWGSNLSKFQGIQMAGGVTFNGAELYAQAEQDLQRLREELNVNAPVQSFLMG